MAWDTLVNIVNGAAGELGLIQSDLSDPYTSTDASIIQLLKLLTSLGKELQEHNWSHLQKSYTFPTVNGTATYAFPADFDAIAGETWWNRSTRLPLGGPLSPQSWQALQAQSSSSVVTTHLRIWGNKIELYPTPSIVETIAYDYRSSYWVAVDASANPTLAAPTAYTNVLWYDRNLLVRGLKLFFQRAKGFDTTASLEDFNKSLARALAADGAKPRLNIGLGLREDTLVSMRNVPDTGYGS